MNDHLLLEVIKASISLKEQHPAVTDVGITGTPSPGLLGLGVEVFWLGAEALGFRQWWIHYDAEA